MKKYDVVPFNALPLNSIFNDVITGIKFEKISDDSGARIENGAVAEFYPEDRCSFICPASASVHAPVNEEEVENS